MKFVIVEKKEVKKRWKFAKLHATNLKNFNEAKTEFKKIIKKYIKSGQFKYYDIGDTYFEFYNFNSLVEKARRIELKSIL